jgi:hypothetical protein
MKTTGSWRAPVYDPEPWTMTSPPARQVLAENLKALMAAHPEIDGTPALERATITKGGKIGKSTIDRILKQATPVNLDYVETLAKVFGVAPWQMLVPGLRPNNPQILRSTGVEEEELYRRIGELAQEIVKLPREEAVERSTPEPQQDREVFRGAERRHK